MKRGDVIRQLTQAGCVLKRNGKGHDIYLNPHSGKSAPVARHSEIKNTLVMHIKKQLGI
ncbi:MAG TPA: type II toxin-antitoxin system HicA family toxin [Bryobacteraceae bacterium]|nr:type II toxin-antitoxin system HicA family toxin [Bryobacteraceae bacterium]